MQYRVLIGAGAGLVALLLTGLALAESSGSDKSPDSSTTTLTLASSGGSTSIPLSPGEADAGPHSLPDRSIKSVAIEQAGVLVIGRSGDAIHIVSATPNAGWTSNVEITLGQVVQGLFQSSDSDIRYTVGLVNGALEIAIETFTGETRLSGAATSTESPTTTGPRPTTQTTDSTVTSTTRQTTTTTAQATTSTTAATTTTTGAVTTTTTPTTTTAAAATTTTTIEPVTTTTEAEADVWIPIVVTSDGGSIFVSYRPGEVRLDGIAPAPTFEVEDVDEDRRSVRVEFEGDDVTYVIEAKWDKGELVTDIESQG